MMSPKQARKMAAKKARRGRRAINQLKAHMKRSGWTVASSKSGEMTAKQPGREGYWIRIQNPQPNRFTIQRSPAIPGSQAEELTP